MDDWTYKKEHDCLYGVYERGTLRGYLRYSAGVGWQARRVSGVHVRLQWQRKLRPAALAVLDLFGQAAITRSLRRTVAMLEATRPVLTPGTRRAVAAIRQELALRRASALDPAIKDIIASGVTSASGIAKELNRKGVLTPCGGKLWQAVQVQRVLAKALTGGAASDRSTQLCCLPTPVV
jgi:hypothetical protein